MQSATITDNIRVKSKKTRTFVLGSITLISVLFNSMFLSCESDPYGSNWSETENLTIYQYLEQNKEEYSLFYQILEKGQLLTTLSAYNPYGSDYTLFLPTNEAVEQFVAQSDDYQNFDELLQDTSFVYTLTRYHTVKRKLHTDEFPYGALVDSTLTGDRLSVSFYTDGENQIIKVNNAAPIIESNLDMTNGYIDIISEVLQKTDIKGYDWLQQQSDYSILAGAMQQAGITKRLWWKKYTLFAENDSIYHRNGIQTVDDLVDRIASPGLPLSNPSNSFYQYVAYHVMGGEYYLNDLRWGSKKYATMSNDGLVINVGVDIQINPGVDVYGIKVSESGDTTIIDYVSPDWENCNIITNTGPVHSITQLLAAEPFPSAN